MSTTALAVPYSQIPAKPVHWLHDGFVPFRHVTVVIGQGGTSKGICTLDYAARMTRGDPMPGEAESACGGPMDVVVVLPEDDANESVAGRLAGAGAVPGRVHNLTVLPGGHMFTVPGDIPLIGQAIDQIEAMDPPADGRPRTVAMVILDPLLALAENDLRTRGQARPVMEELEHMAQARHLVIFLTHHANADGRAASSRAITETARNVITLARMPKAAEDDPVRVLTVTKTNIGRTGQSLRYVLTGTLEEPHVVWECEQPAASDNRGYDMDAQAAHDLACRRARALPGQPHAVHPQDSTGRPRSSATTIHGWQARQACEQAAGQLLGWHGVPVAGMEGAEVRTAGG